MKLVNFSHPLTPAQLDDLRERFALPIESVLSVPTQFDAAQPFGEQVVALVNSVGFSPAEWQHDPPEAFPSPQKRCEKTKQNSPTRDVSGCSVFHSLTRIHFYAGNATPLRRPLCFNPHSNADSLPLVVLDPQSAQALFQSAL